jgi:light-regulated signal transduction histidine kinase (bacteriophytochrome)
VTQLPSSASATAQRRHRVLDAAMGTTCSRREHDMRNYLYLITSFAQLMSDGLGGAVTDRQKEFLGHVLDCTHNLHRLLEAGQA